MTLEGHYPEEENKTGYGNKARPLERVVCFSFLPTEIENKAKTYRIEYRQLIRKVFQKRKQVKALVAV